MKRTREEQTGRDEDGDEKRGKGGEDGFVKGVERM